MDLFNVNTHKDTHTNKMIRICNSLWANKRQMRTVPADQVVKDILRARAMRTSCNYCEILKGDPVDMSSSSVFDRELSTVKPFFDYYETISPIPED